VDVARQLLFSKITIKTGNLSRLNKIHAHIKLLISFTKIIICYTRTYLAIVIMVGLGRFFNTFAMETIELSITS